MTRGVEGMPALCCWQGGCYQWSDEEKANEWEGKSTHVGKSNDV